jgi:membrane protein YdbS with pleckstrin-like domain
MDAQIEEKIYSLERPNSKLVVLYFVRSLAAFIMAPIVFIPLYFKYISLRYHFDKEGVGASWGIFFKKQVFLTYARIQDIHVNRGLVERWLGLGTVEVQTASGSATAELSIVGLEEFDEIRDFLYTKMRGAKGLIDPNASQEEQVEEQTEALGLLLEIRDELRSLREEIGRRA